MTAQHEGRLPHEMLKTRVRQDMQAWLERAVIGLNLCPFAKSVHVKGQIHWAVSLATQPRALLDELERELQDLHAADPEVRDTTLLVAPWCLQNFLDFNDFLDAAETILVQLGLEGELQIASFHPQFQFAGTLPEDITNATNRAPYPALHLLREASIDRAVAVFPEAEAIFEKNMQTLQQLGPEGWSALGLQARVGPTAASDEEEDSS